MAKRFTDLPPLTTPAAEDQLAIVDTSANVTKRITLLDMLRDFIDAVHLKANSVITSKLNNGAVTSAKFKPSTIISDFAITGTRYNLTTTGSWVDITNATITYTSGATPERFIGWFSTMASKDANNGEVRVVVNGTALPFQTYHDASQSWARATMPFTFDMLANTSYTIKLQAQNFVGGNFYITTESPVWKPQIYGFTIYNGA